VLFLEISFLTTKLEEANAAGEPKEAEMLHNNETMTRGSRGAKDSLRTRIPRWVPTAWRQQD